MKRCPECGRDYNDDSLSFCLDDGSELLFGPKSLDEPQTALLHATDAPGEAATRAQIHTTEQTTGPPATSDGNSASAKRSLDKRLIAAPVVAVLLAVAVYFGYRQFTTSGDQINSIAVMPFQNDSASADSEYLSDGIMESLIYRLSQIDNLKVSPSSSVLRYKGKNMDSIKTGKELGVQAVMTGRIAQRGDDLIVSVELVDVTNNKTLWGERYNRKMSELLATQREIANEIAQKLKIELAGDPGSGLQKSYTTNSKAYELFLKGRFHYEKRTKADIEKGIDYYNEALALDPNFALAYVGIANAYGVMPSYGFMAPKEAGPKARAAAQKALEIDPGLAEAHAAFANVAAALFWDWATAEREFQKALEMNPNDAITHIRYGSNYLLRMGRTGEAVSELKRALELEPLSIVAGALLAETYIGDGQSDKALEQIRATENLEPGHNMTAYWLMVIYVSRGMYNEALQITEARLLKEPNDQDSLGIAGYIHAKNGEREKAEKILSRLREMSETQYVLDSYVAQIYGALGEKDKAFAELEKAYEQKDFFVPTMRTNPMFKDLRDDPRFDQIAKRAGLPDRK
jgi:TolB-like protein/Tfp pilus assembly protein PilF